MIPSARPFLAPLAALLCLTIACRQASSDAADARHPVLTEQVASTPETASPSPDAVGQALVTPAPVAAALPGADGAASAKTLQPDADAKQVNRARPAPASRTADSEPPATPKPAATPRPTSRATPAASPSDQPTPRTSTTTTRPTPEVQTAPPAGVDHSPFTALLRRHVSSTGAVDYAGLKRDRAALDAYLNTLAGTAPDRSWSRDARLAYWINAYNAATLQLIVDNYPLKSIQDLDGGKPWDVRRVELGGETYTLNAIENEIIRPRFNEPRIHFAVNCAAKGCPPLRNEAFVPERLDAQLREQTERFLNDSRYTSVEGGTLKVSKIFDWYGSDFGDVAAFVRRYRDLPPAVEVEFASYDWALNQR